MKTKAITCTLFFYLLLGLKIFAQTCYTENIYFSTQQQINEFATNGHSCIQGNVLISGNKIINLDGLSQLVSIDGNLQISRNNVLSNLNGLNNLSAINGILSILDVDALTSLAGLENLGFIGGDIEVKFNQSLKNLKGLEKVNYIEGSLLISDNPNFISFEGLENLSTIGKDFIVYLIEKLVNFEGLENLISIGGHLFVGFNNAMTSLSGLDNIDPESISNLYLQEVKNLTTCDIASICSYLSDPDNPATIRDNGRYCNSRKAIVSNCINDNTFGTEFSQSKNNSIPLNNYPNPFSKSTAIGFSLETAQNVTLTIFDRQGKQVKQWANELKYSGSHHIDWDARNDSLKVVPAGIYYFQIKSDTFVETIAMIRID